MKTRVTITDSQAPAEPPVTGDGVSPAEFGALYQAGFESGFASGRDAGYRQGYEAGYAEGSRERGAGSRKQAAGGRKQESQARPHRALLGLPCAHCGCFFYSEETQCPRCKKSRE